jgi:mono/diheme cytochrome c family protein
VRPPAAALPGDARAGRAVFARMGCGSCHRLAAAGSSGQIGPPLDQVLDRHTAASLRAKITAPGGGSIMPQDFARRMSPADLRALVAFLLAARDGRVPR